jgi:hypothetical protein
MNLFEEEQNMASGIQSAYLLSSKPLLILFSEASQRPSRDRAEVLIGVFFVKRKDRSEKCLAEA